MKIAGQKNSGAWSRANAFIKSLADGSAGSANAQADLVNKIKAIPSWPGFIAALQAIFEKTGANGTDATAITSDSLSQTYGTKGIPRWVWMGLAAWTTYTKVGNQYKPDGAKAFATFADDLRSTIVAFKLTIRLMEDTVNQASAKDGNPGGVADDTQGT